MRLAAMAHRVDPGARSRRNTGCWRYRRWRPAGGPARGAGAPMRVPRDARGRHFGSIAGSAPEGSSGMIGAPRRSSHHLPAQVTVRRRGFRSRENRDQDSSMKAKIRRTLTSILPVAANRRGACNNCGACCKLPTPCRFLGYKASGESYCLIYKIRRSTAASTPAPRRSSSRGHLRFHVRERRRGARDVRPAAGDVRVLGRAPAQLMAHAGRQGPRSRRHRAPTDGNRRLRPAAATVVALLAQRASPCRAQRG